MSTPDWDELLFLPTEEECFAYLGEQRWPEEPACPYCHGTDPIRKGATSNGPQRYYCDGCEQHCNDLTGTIFAQHRLSIAEMFSIIRMMERESTTEISRSLDRTYKTVLEVVHEVLDAFPTRSSNSLASVKPTKSPSSPVRRGATRTTHASAASQKGTRNVRRRQPTSPDARPP